MKLTVIGSGSKGNCYLIHDKKECLIIEAGLPFKEVKKSLNFNINKIVGVVVSHMHMDHSKYANEYLKAGIPVFKPYEIVYSPQNSFGNFTFQHFKLVHDAECYGYLIKHKDIGKLLFATDTEYIKYKFEYLNHILVECNYSQKIIDEVYHKSLRDRVMNTHMELETCKSFIRTNNSPSLINVCLLHLSDGTSDEKMFKEEVEKIVDANVYVADKGVEFDLDLVPF